MPKVAVCMVQRVDVPKLRKKAACPGRGSEQGLKWRW